MRVAHLAWLPLLAILILLLGCSSSQGLPPAPGQYEIKSKSLTYDGREYQLYWKDKDGQLRRATTEKLKMVEDERTYLEMQSGEPIVHLAAEEPVNVVGEDRQGGFNSMWYPFLIGQTLGSFGGGRTVVINQPAPGTPDYPRNVPTYHYPPADSFGRGDTLQGSVTNSKPAPPDYGKITPAPYAVSGQAGGTGAGTAASGKSVTASGQGGGTGAGSAASSKGGFAKGQSSYQARGGSSSATSALSGGGSSSVRKGAPSSGVSGGKAGSGKSSGGIRSGGGGRRR